MKRSPDHVMEEYFMDVGIGHSIFGVCKFNRSTRYNTSSPPTHDSIDDVGRPLVPVIHAYLTIAELMPTNLAQ